MRKQEYKNTNCESSFKTKYVPCDKEHEVKEQKCFNLSIITIITFRQQMLGTF